MSLDYVSLHHHSTYSYLDGYGMPEDHVEVAADLGLPALFLTEHGNVSSHVRLEKAAKAAGIKPGFGCELYTGAVGEDAGRYKWHLTVLAENAEGYRNLLRLVSRGWAEGFYYEPTVSGEMLAEHSEGLIVLSGCSGSKLACDLVGGKGVDPHPVDLKSGLATAARFKELLGDRYYLEVQTFPELERTQGINQSLVDIGRRLGIPLVATGDVHYPKPDQNKMQILLHAVERSGQKKKGGVSFEKQAQSWGYDIRLATLTGQLAMDRLIQSGLTGRDAVAAVQASWEIAQRCNVEIPKLKELQYPTPEGSEALLRAWCRKGWEYRGIDRLPADQRSWCVRRVKYELPLIIEKGFADYFLTIADVVSWAKDNDIAVGPARGSAAASLICYLLRITEVNPLYHPNLLFERFIDINRHDLPDIDLDFDDDQRWRIRQYLVDKYGEDRVGNIGTFVKYKGKNSLDDVARVHNVPLNEVATVKEMLIERASGDLRGNATIEDTIAMFPKVRQVFERHPVLFQAQQLEGNLRGFSVHAAGLVVADEPLTNSCAVYTRYDKNGEVIGEVLSIDKYDAEYVNALKIDILGLTTMGLINRCLKMIGMSIEELYAIPLDDEKVFDAFKRNDVVGIFQFDGRAMRSVNREVKPDNFAEVCDINALARPGPLHSGAAAEYIMVKHGKKKPEKLHPIVSEITAHTNQQIVYQEQILQVVRRLGNFTWEEAANVRKLISKKQGEQAFNRLQGKFIEGCRKNGVADGVAGKIWKQLVTAGAYAFNAAHCVSYGMLAYWTMWLKVHHPLEFYCAALQKYDDKRKVLDIMIEADKRDVTILPPDPVLSQASWTVYEGCLLAGLTQVDGIGEKMAPTMLAYREEVGVEDWADYEAVSGIGPKTIDKIEAFCNSEDPFGLKVLSDTIRKVRRWIWENGDQYDLPYPSSKSEDIPYEAIPGEHVWIGVVRDRNLKDLYELHRSRTGEELDPKTVREPEHINWMVLTCEDETGPLVVTVHRYGGMYERLKDELMDIELGKDLLLVRGMKRKEYRRAIYAKQIWVLEGEQ